MSELLLFPKVFKPSIRQHKEELPEQLLGDPKLPEQLQVRMGAFSGH